MRRLVLALLLPLLMASPSWAATITNLVQSGTQDTWLSGAATLASNSNALSGVVSVTNPSHLSAYCTLDLASGTTVTVTAGTAVIAWMLVSTDGGTLFEDGGPTFSPARQPDLIFPLLNVASRQIVGFRVDKLPPVPFKLLARNDGTGATINTTWSVKCRTYTPQVLP